MDYNLYLEDQLHTFYFNFFNKEYPTISYNDLKSKIKFLKFHGLGEKWVRIFSSKIGHFHIFPNQLKMENIVISVPLIYVFNLAQMLEVINPSDINRYISKLNNNSIDQLSTCYEIEIASNFMKKGFDIDIEPNTGMIGKSGGKKSDLLIRYHNHEIYLEISSMSLAFQARKTDPKHRISNLVTDVCDLIESKRILPTNLKINATLHGGLDQILKKNWQNGFIDYLFTISNNIIINRKYQFNGIDFIFMTKSDNDITFMLNRPFNTNILSKFNRKLKEEMKQIPSNGEGIIVLALPSVDNACLRYAQNMLKKNLIGIVLFIGTDLRLKKYVFVKEGLDSELTELITNHINISCILT